MRKTFKFLGTVLVLVMFLTALFGCGSGETAQDGNVQEQSTSVDKGTSDDQESVESVELTFMGWQPDLNMMNSTMIPAIEEKYPNITIKAQILDWFAYWDKLTVETAAGEGPDIAAMDVDHIPTYYDYLEPLEDLASQVIGSDWKLKFKDGVIDSLKVIDDKVMMLPSESTGLWYLFYNKTLCDELNVSPPTGDYADLVNFVSKVNASGKDILPIAFAGKEDVNVGFFWLWLVNNNQYGIVKDAVNGNAKFTDEPFVKAFEQLKKMMDDRVIDEKTFGLDAYPGADTTFKNRNAVSYLTGQWSMGGYLMGSQLNDTAIENDELGIVVLKNINGGETVMQKYASLGYSINVKCKYKEEAMQVAAEWTLGKAAQKWVNYQGTVPAAKDIKLDESLMKTNEAKKTFQAAIDALNSDKVVLRSTLNSSLDNKIGEVVVSVLRKGMSVEDALNQIQKAADALME